MPSVRVESQNEKTYGLANIVQYYTQLKALQPAEQMVLDRLSPELCNLKMLDIGVGAGRTTQHFHLRTAHYTGIDNSAEMIAACQKRFPDAAQTMFEVCDARDMGRFETDSFDFILFSFNGIDYVSQTDRLSVLAEIRRVGKPGAIFCFSSHNLQGFEQAFDLKSQWSCNPIVAYTNLVMLFLLRVLNRPLTLAQLKALSYAIVKDESHNFRLNTYYIRPQDQIAQLEANFSDIQVYSWRNDIELVTETDRVTNVDMWLYYLCTVKVTDDSLKTR
jgi:ubiquinone/menaquinone biosynthesis C-methylase UbiE